MTITDGPAQRLERHDVDEDTEGAASLPETAADTVLRSRRRREILRAVQNADGPIAVDRVIERLVEQDAGVSPVDRRRIAVSVRHYYLPRLEEYGVLAYDRDGDTVRPATNFGQFGSRLDRGGESNGYRAGVAGVSAAVLVGMTAGPVALSTLVLAAIVTAVVAVGAAIDRVR